MYHPDIGGIETIVKQYAECLSKSFDVTVLTSSGSKRFKTVIEYINGVRIIRCPSFGIFFSMPISITLFMTLISSRHKYDVIHFHEPFPIASFIGIFPKKCKYIVTWHSDIIKQKLLKNFIEFFQKKLCNKSDIILTTSPNLIEFSSVLKHFRNKIKVQPLTIDPEEYDINIPENKYDYALYIGRLSYYKGINFMLKAYEKSDSKIPLYIVGDGEKEIRDDINSFIKKSSKEIVFINRYVSEDDKKCYLKNCKYLIFPSIYPSEAFGLIQLEAMIYSKPVINTSLPTGVPWVSVHNITGITVQVNDEEELKKAINDFSSDKLVETYGKAARQRVENMFSDKVVLNNLLQIYKELLK